MNYNAYIPTKLSGIVDLIWEQEMPNPGSYTILPSGKVELLFPLYQQVEVKAKKIQALDNPVKNYTNFLSGLHTKPLEMRFDRFHTFGIQMKPVAVKALFSIPLCEIKDYFVEGSQVLKTIIMMEDMLHSKSSFTERAQWFENFMLERIHETADLHAAIKMERIVQQYSFQAADGSNRNIEDLMGYSRTHAFRLFREWFGTSAHAYQKLLQFIRTVETLHNPSVNLTDAGLSNDYYDQSHFIRSFQEFANMTPGEYRKQMSTIPGQLFSV